VIGDTNAISAPPVRIHLQASWPFPGSDTRRFFSSFLFNFYVALAAGPAILSRSTYSLENPLNAELAKKALEKVGNPNVLVNLVSRRVRQLNSGGGAMSRPLVADTGAMGAADIALLEIVEEKMGWEMPELVELTRPVGKKRKKH
jgi:DNA-directed RNA polymerase subunit omega